MKVLIHNKIIQKPHTLFVGIAITVFTLAGIAGAMQEYEDLKIQVAEIEYTEPYCLVDCYLDCYGNMWILWLEWDTFDLVWDYVGNTQAPAIGTCEPTNPGTGQASTDGVHIDDREFEIDSHRYALTTTSTGTVKWFNPRKGYGFIIPDDGGDDLFVHHSEIKTTGDAILSEGQKVEFEIGQGRKGPCATNLVPL